MNAAEIIGGAKWEGVILALSPVGSVTATGEQSAVDLWLPIIRDNKPGILRELQRERRRAKVLAMLAADPGLRYAIHVDDASTDPVVATVGIRPVATLDLEIPSRYYDGIALLELVESYSGAQYKTI